MPADAARDGDAHPRASERDARACGPLSPRARASSRREDLVAAYESYVLSRGGARAIRSVLIANNGRACFPRSRTRVAASEHASGDARAAMGEETSGRLVTPRSIERGGRKRSPRGERSVRERTT